MTATDWIQAISMIVLVIVTGIYAWRTHVMSKATKEQAEASMIMAEETREQRITESRPIIIQKAVLNDVIAPGFSDQFEIYNAGNGPAVELEIILLDKEKNLLGIQRETFFPRVGEIPINFNPEGLQNHVDSTCYLICQYRSVLSSETKQIWYQTWLPFVSVKSQSKDYMIIQPKELEFREVDTKQNF